jgi:hypothetical protein
VLGHLTLERAAEQAGRQLLEDAVLSCQVFWLLVVGEQLIDQLVRDPVAVMFLRGHR